MAAKKPPEQARRPSRGQMTTLPADGPTDPAPKWPLGDFHPGESEIWAEVWTYPQATSWRQLRSHRVVARYVRILARVEAGGGGSGVNWSNEARQLEDRLGLSPKAAFLLNFRVAEERPVAPVTDLNQRIADLGKVSGSGR